jgi:hypothetical protein
MKRGSSDDELTPPLRGDNMLSAVQRTAGVDLIRTPLQFEDQAAALHLGHFAKRSVLGPYVTGMLDGTGTEADPGISSLQMSNTVRNASAASNARELRITRQLTQPKQATLEPGRGPVPGSAHDLKAGNRFPTGVRRAP